MSRSLLALGSRVVPGEEHLVHRVARLGQLEGVGEHDAVERLVLRILPRAGQRLAVGVLDVDGSDVVGQQQDLVGVQFFPVLARQVVRANQPRLQEARNERPRPRERVEDVHALVARARLRSAPAADPTPSG